MDEAFEKLKKEGQNSVDNLVKWIKDSKVVENTQAGEEKAKKLFEGVKDKSNVELENFKAAVAKLADEQQKNLEDFTKKIVDQAPVFLNALKQGASAAVDAGVSAFKETMQKK